MTTTHNLSFFKGRQDKTTDGILLSPVKDPVTGKLAFAVILGGLSKRDAARSTTVPIDMKNRPELLGERAVSGSVITEKRDGKDLKVLAAYKENGVWYTLVRTGLFVQGGGTTQDLIALQDSGVDLTAHGSFSLDAGAVKVSSGKGFELSKVPAERLRWSVKGNIPVLEVPQFRYDFWQIPVDAAVLVQDINGRLTRLVGMKDRLAVVDAPAATYRPVFEALEIARIEARKAEALKRKSAPAGAATAPKA